MVLWLFFYGATFYILGVTANCKNIAEYQSNVRVVISVLELVYKNLSWLGVFSTIFYKSWKVRGAVVMLYWFMRLITSLWTKHVFSQIPCNFPDRTSSSFQRYKLASCHDKSHIWTGGIAWILIQCWLIHVWWVLCCCPWTSEWKLV